MTIDEHSPSPADAIARVRELALTAAGIAKQPGTAVVPSGVGEAEAVKAGMVEQRAELMRQKQAVESAAAEAKAAVEATVKQMQAELAAQMALLEPALKQLAKLSDGVDALNIYLGRDEEIIPLCEGERAPAGTVISVRQLVLAMDEESVLFADTDGLDFRNIDDFSEWLVRDPRHIDQVLPELKGVVALIPRRARKNYSDPWMQIQADEENAHTWWLVRNGQNCWLTTTQFVVGTHTVPPAKEFTDMFVIPSRFGRKARQMVPGSSEWQKAEERADLRTRHYMKVALLLQGLLDRTTVFHPHDGTSFLLQEHYDAGRVKIVLDGENAITDGRLGYREWRNERVARMHEGMRVIGAFSTKMRTYDSRDYGASEVRPKGCSPRNLVPYNVRSTSRSYFNWEFSFERTDKVWDENDGWRLPKTKATGFLDNSDGWWIPLDTITEDEIHYYLNARTQRHAYLDMIPTLQAALAVKVAEREAEAEFRAALIDALAREVAAAEPEALADELIVWFKTGNKHHRALDAADAKAAKAILTEARRRALGESGADAKRVAAILKLHPEAMVIARRSADFVVAVPEQRKFPGQSATVFCRLAFYTPAGKLVDERPWSTLTRAQTSRWTVHHHTDVWESWTLNPDTRQHYTDEELDGIAEHFSSRIPAAFVIRVSVNKMNDCAEGRVYAWTPEAGVSDIGFNVDRVKGKVSVLTYWTGLKKSSVNVNEPTWLTNWHGSPSIESDIWRDREIEAKAKSEWDELVTKSKLSQRARNRSISICSALEDVWEAAAELIVRDRFVEDFGDVSLWEGHRKTIKLPTYPFRWNSDRALRDGLAEYFTREPDADVTGLTVADLLTLVGVEHGVVDASILMLVPLPAD